MESQFRFSAMVKHGDQHGRSIGYPTINLDPELWPVDFASGVYASKVTIDGKVYLGALYFGPRTIRGETKNVLEITLLNFSSEVYGVEVAVEVGSFVRPPIDYQPGKRNESELQKQIADDILHVIQLGKTRWSQFESL